MKRTLVPPPLARAVVAVICASVGPLLRGPPADPDGDFGGLQILGAFLVFVFFAHATLAWGNLLARAAGVSDRSLFVAAALGTAGAALASFALSHAGLIGPARADLLRGLLLLGLAVDAGLSLRKASAPSPSLSPPASTLVERLLVTTLVAVVVLLSLKGAVPDGHPDPLYYHLLGPRLWSAEGRAYLPPQMPIVYLCWMWEYLYVWGHSLLGGAGAEGLIEGQLFGQWTHAVLGTGGCALALAALFRAHGADRVGSLLAALAGTCAAAMVWTGPLAKNDYGSSFWGLAGCALCSLPAWRTPARLVIGAALVGLSLTAKLTVAFTILPLFAACLFFPRSLVPLGGKGTGAVFLGLVLGSIPILSRNLLATGDPFFPLFAARLSSVPLSQTWEEHLVTFSGLAEGAGQSSLALGWERLALLFRQSPLVLCLALPIVLPRARFGRPAFLPLWGAVATALVLYGTVVGERASLRLLGPGNLLVCGVSVLCLDWAAKALPAARTAIIGLSAAFVLFLCDLPWRIGLDLIELPPARDLIRHANRFVKYNPVGGDAKAFLRQHARAGELVVSLEDNRLYYLAHLDVVAIQETRELDARFRGLSDPAAFAAALKQMKARYVLDTTDWRAPFRGKLSRRLAPQVDRSPGAVLFQGDHARVIAVDRLVEGP
jgi:hypothetical protein